jgi:hypothetical protein
VKCRSSINPQARPFWKRPIAIADDRYVETDEQEIVMLTPRIFLAFGALIVGTVAMVSTGSFADSAMPAPNTINNATHERTVSPSTGTYDPEDSYGDPRGFPQLGWQYLPRPPS